MLELNNERFKGNFNRYKQYIIEISGNIGDSLKKDGWEITSEIFDVEGEVRRYRTVKGCSCQDIKYYDKKMVMTADRGNEKVSVVVKKSTEDKHDDIFMHALGLYRLQHEIKNIEKKKSKELWNHYRWVVHNLDTPSTYIHRIKKKINKSD